MQEEAEKETIPLQLVTTKTPLPTTKEEVTYTQPVKDESEPMRTLPETPTIDLLFDHLKRTHKTNPALFLNVLNTTKQQILISSKEMPAIQKELATISQQKQTVFYIPDLAAVVNKIATSFNKQFIANFKKAQPGDTITITLPSGNMSVHLLQNNAAKIVIPLPAITQQALLLLPQSSQAKTIQLHSEPSAIIVLPYGSQTKNILFEFEKKLVMISSDTAQNILRFILSQSLKKQEIKVQLRQQKRVSPIIGKTFNLPERLIKREAIPVIFEPEGLSTLPVFKSPPKPVKTIPAFYYPRYNTRPTVPWTPPVSPRSYNPASQQRIMPFKLKK